MGGSNEAEVRDTGNHQDERLLIQQLLARDEAAFSELVAALHGSLLRLALTFVQDRGAAEEVVQETWLGVIKGLRSFEGRSSLKTWIFRILVNRARTRGARDGRVVTFSALETSDGERDLADRFTQQGRWLHPPARWEEQDPEDLLLRREAVRHLHDAVADLPSGQRAVITLRDIEGVEPPEVCNILGVTETNQRVLLHRARTKVRAALEERLGRRARGTSW
jgi:RNA polymerase sigma-70 factor (ECF subfamily)